MITGATENNLSPANIGQVKWMAITALAALRQVAAELADELESDLQGVADWEPPNPGSPEAQGQYSALLLGQCKAIAHPFYSHLNEGSSEWVLGQIEQNHDGAAVLGEDYWLVTTTTGFEDGYYPWNPATASSVNRSMANIGQIKALFSLRFFEDSNLNQLPDFWEMLHFGQMGIADPDERLFPDGLTNKEKSELGLGPTADDLSLPDQRITYSYDGDRLDIVNYYTTREVSYGVDDNGNIETTTSD